MEPPGRSSLHRFPNDPAIAPFWADITPNYNDNELFCGGFWNQVSNDYRCGVCGNDYNEARPRSNELGGKYGSSSIIPRTYSSGQLIPVRLQLHLLKPRSQLQKRIRYRTLRQIRQLRQNLQQQKARLVELSQRQLFPVPVFVRTNKIDYIHTKNAQNSIIALMKLHM